MALAGIQQLVKENEMALLRERRSAERKPFVRPVTITTGQEETHHAFSRDFSLQGISVVCDTPWPVSTIAALTIHSLEGKHVKVKAEVRWCNPYGEGWYNVGWVFLQ